MKPTLRILLALAFLFSFQIQLFGQKKGTVLVGIGFAETINLGARFSFLQRSEIGMSIGTWPSSDDWLFDWKSLISVSGDYYYHFGGTAKFSERSPWYFRIGLDYIRIAYESEVTNNLESHLRMGRDIYFSEAVGICLDAGLSAFLLNEEGFTPFLPAYGIGFFVRF